MKNKFFFQLLLSSIILAWFSLLLYKLVIYPMIDYILMGNSDTGMIVVVAIAPIVIILFLIALCFFILSLVKFIENRKQKN